MWYRCPTDSWALFSVCWAVVRYCQFWHTLSLFRFFPVFSSLDWILPWTKSKEGEYCTSAMLSSLKELNTVAQEIREFLFITSIFESPEKSSIGHLVPCSYLCTHQLLRSLRYYFKSCIPIRILLHYSQVPQNSGQLITLSVQEFIWMFWCYKIILTLL